MPARRISPLQQDRKMDADLDEKQWNEEFGRFVKTHNGALRAYALSLGSSDSEEFVQDALLMIFKKKEMQFDSAGYKPDQQLAYAKISIRYKKQEAIRKKKREGISISIDQNSENFENDGTDYSGGFLSHSDGNSFRELVSNTPKPWEVMSSMEEAQILDGFVDDLPATWKDAWRKNRQDKVRKTSLSFSPEDILQRSGILLDIRQSSDPAVNHLRSLLSQDLLKIILGSETLEFSFEVCEALAKEFNMILMGPLIYEESVHLHILNKNLAKQLPAALSSPALDSDRNHWINMGVIEATFASSLGSNNGAVRAILSDAERALSGREWLEEIIEFTHSDSPIFICSRLARTTWTEAALRFLKRRMFIDEASKLSFGRACGDVLDVGEPLNRAFSHRESGVTNDKIVLRRLYETLMAGFQLKGKVTKAGVFLSKMKPEWLAEFLEDLVFEEPPVPLGKQNCADFETLLSIRTPLIRIYFGQKMHLDVSQYEEKGHLHKTMDQENYFCHPTSQSQEIATSSELLRCASGRLSLAETIELEERVAISPYLSSRLEELRENPDVANAILMASGDTSPSLSPSASSRWADRLSSLSEGLRSKISKRLLEFESWTAPLPAQQVSAFAKTRQSCEIAGIRINHQVLENGGISLQLTSDNREFEGLLLKPVILSSALGSVVWESPSNIRLEWHENLSTIIGAAEIAASGWIETKKANSDAVVSFRIINR